MRQRARVDKSQKKYVDYFRKAGASVLHLHQVGSGCPDLLIGYLGMSVLVEVKEVDGKFTDDQVNFALHWNGSYTVVRSIKAAEGVLGWIRLKNGYATTAMKKSDREPEASWAGTPLTPTAGGAENTTRPSRRPRRPRRRRELDPGRPKGI